MPPSRLIVVGAFVIGGLFLFAMGLFMIGNRRLLFNEQFEVYAEFWELAGLQNGAKVRVAGMDAGEVTTIVIPARPSNRFRVRMRVREDLHPLVRVDSVASIQTDGLVGNKLVQIDVGSEKASRVPATGTIASREPFDFADLLQRASDTVDTINTTISQLRGQIEEVLTAIKDTTIDTNRIVEAVGSDIEAITEAGRRISIDASRMVAEVRAGHGTIGKLVTEDELYTRVVGVARETEATVRTARQASEQARMAIENLAGATKGTDGPVQRIFVDLQRTLADTRETMSDLADNTEALKRSFLFRGFFKDRGYYDLNELTASDYRAGALGGEHRQPIRIWLGADVLFEPLARAQPVATRGSQSPQAQERRDVLSSDGRVRLDAAMAELLRYPKTTPLIVESYANGETRDARHRRATDRAAQVRDYLIKRYGLEANRLGVMPLDAEATGSPGGGTWDGVGLAAWVDVRVLK